MRTKIKNIFFSVTLLAIVSLFVTSCDNEDYTGYSTLKVSSPTISITAGVTSPVTLVENDTKYEFTVTLSEPQIVDIHLAVKQIDGTASASDYELTSTIVIPAGATSAKGSIKILSDDAIEDTESLTIQIGDQTTANGNLTPITVEFSIQNLTGDDLVIGLSWEPSIKTTDNLGNDISPTDLADLRLLITDSPYTTILGGADGGSFESYTMSGSMADGEYLVVADFYAALDLPVRDLNLSLSFEQLGVIERFSYDFANAINTGTICPSNYFILAKIIKTGSTYTIEEVGGLPPLTGAWYGVDTEFEYPSEVSTRLDCDGNLLITGLVFGWMLDFWGEEVVAQEDVIINVDLDAGTVDIPYQAYITTLYKGTEYPYSIVGSGTIDNSGEYPVMTITYVLDQEGFNPSQWCFDNGYMANADFTATITLDPAGLKSATVKSAVIRNSKPLVKPVRR